jgi:hypothetical protein
VFVSFVGLFSLFGFSESSNKTNQTDQMNQTDQNNQPVLALRDNTERPETITIGTNEFIRTDPSNLPPALARVMAGQWGKARSLRNGIGKELLSKQPRPPLTSS